MRRWLKATPLAWLVLAAPASAAPTIQEFTIPTADAQPQDLVLGPRCNIWFTERARFASGRPPAATGGASAAGSTAGIRLRPGRYRMPLRARDAAGNVSLPDRLRFRLLPRLG